MVMADMIAHVVDVKEAFLHGEFEDGKKIHMKIPKGFEKHFPVESVLLLLKCLFRIPHKPPAGSLKVLHAPAHWGGIRRASQTKIYNLETDEFISNLPFSKQTSRHFHFAVPLWREQLGFVLI